MTSVDEEIFAPSAFVVKLIANNAIIGVGRGGGQGGGGGGGGGGAGPPNSLKGGANIPFGPPNNPPTFSFNFYVKQEKITNIPS